MKGRSLHIVQAYTAFESFIVDYTTSFSLKTADIALWSQVFQPFPFIEGAQKPTPKEDKVTQEKFQCFTTTNAALLVALLRNLPNRYEPLSGTCPPQYLPFKLSSLPSCHPDFLAMSCVSANNAFTVSVLISFAGAILERTPPRTPC